MRPITHRFTLDMHDTQSQISIPVHCGDSGRKLFITLSEGGKPYEIGEGCYAYINARTPANTTQSLMCNIANNTIEFDFSENNDAVNMIAVVGLTHCDVTLFDADGYIVTAPRFTFVVIDQISNPRNVELSSDDVSLLSNWTSKFASWDTAETGRKSQEETRQSNELTRESQESIRQDNENERKENELSRIANEFARNSAETERQQTYEEAKESLTSVIAKANEAKISASIASSAKDTALEEANRATSAADRASESAQTASATEIRVNVSANLANASSQAAAKARNEAVAAASSVSSMVVNKDLDYLIHYNFRMQQLTANIGESNKPPNATGRGIGILPLNVNAVVREDFEGGQYTDYGFIIMHPKAIGSFSINAGAGECGCLLVSKGITSLTVGSGVRTIDLSLLTGIMPFPSLSVTDSTIWQVTVQKGRKAELQSMTNWSDCNIVEVETW